MAYTPFDYKQFEDSNNLHEKNKDFIYPYVYGVPKEHISYDDNASNEDTRQFQDFHEGRDCTFEVIHPKWEYPAKHTSQYRFRDDQWQQCQDLTVTLNNPNSGLAGELFKLLVELFVYGYYHKPTNQLVELLVADCQGMRNGILNGTLPYKIGRPNRRSKQPFITVKFRDLYAQDMVLLHWKEVNGSRKLLHKESLKLLPALRQTNPQAPITEGIARAEQGYNHRGEPRQDRLWG